MSTWWPSGRSTDTNWTRSRQVNAHTGRGLQVPYVEDNIGLASGRQRTGPQIKKVFPVAQSRRWRPPLSAAWSSVPLLRKEIAIHQRGKSAATLRQVWHDQLPEEWEAERLEYARNPGASNPSGVHTEYEDRCVASRRRPVRPQAYKLCDCARLG